MRRDLKFEILSSNATLEEFVLRNLRASHLKARNCDPPREKRDKGDSTLTTRFHLKTIDFDFSTLKACSETCLISKSFVLQNTLNTKKRARPKKKREPSNNKSVSSFKTKVVCQLRAKKHNTLSVRTRTQSVTNLFFEERSCYSTE